MEVLREIRDIHGGCLNQNRWGMVDSSDWENVARNGADLIDKKKSLTALSL